MRAFNGISSLALFTSLLACADTTTHVVINCAWNGTFELVLGDGTPYQGTLNSDPRYCGQPYYSKHDPNRLLSGYLSPDDGSNPISIEIRITADDGDHVLTPEPWVWPAEQDSGQRWMNQASYAGMLSMDYPIDTLALRVGLVGDDQSVYYLTSVGSGQARMLAGSRWCYRPGDTGSVSLSMTGFALSNGATLALNAETAGAMIESQETASSGANGASCASAEEEIAACPDLAVNQAGSYCAEACVYWWNCRCGQPDSCANVDAACAKLASVGGSGTCDAYCAD